jgi:hypothetical protein
MSPDRCTSSTVRYVDGHFEGKFLSHDCSFQFAEFVFKENRLAQLATVEQQRELMRYMRGLNEWLETDVRDRQTELREVGFRIDELRRDILGRLGVPPGLWNWLLLSILV